MTEPFNDGNGENRMAHDGGRRRPGLDCSIRPGVPVPPTLLVAEMRDGAMFLQGWRDGACAYIIAAEAGPLRDALVTAFGGGNSTAVRP